VTAAGGDASRQWLLWGELSAEVSGDFTAIVNESIDEVGPQDLVI
jgi:hypothetical protein